MKKITKYLMAFAATALTATAVTAGVQAVEGNAKAPEAGKTVATAVAKERVAHEAVAKKNIKKAPRQKEGEEIQPVTIEDPAQVIGEYVLQCQTYFSYPTIDGNSVTISDGKEKGTLVLTDFYAGADVQATINADGFIEIPSQVVGTTSAGAELSLVAVDYVTSTDPETGDESGSFVPNVETPILVALYEDGILEVQNDYCVTPLASSGWYALNAAGGLLYPANGVMYDYEAVTDPTTSAVSYEVSAQYNVLISVDEENNTATIKNWGDFARDIIVNFDYNGKFSLAFDQVVYDGTDPSYNLWGFDGEHVDDSDIVGTGGTDLEIVIPGWAAISDSRASGGSLRGFTRTRSSISINREAGIVFPYKKLAVDHLEGAGTEEDPFQIASIDDLVFFQFNVNGLLGDAVNYKDQFVALTADLDLAGVNFDPIGDTQAHAFAGTFDGQEHKISNLTITNAHNFSGFFGFANATSVIKNLTLDEAACLGFNFNYVGAVAGMSQGTIDNCSVTSTQGIEGNNFVGGIAGRGNIITNCYANCDGRYAGVFSYAGNAGGITGYIAKEASGNINEGNPGSYSGPSTTGVGGIAGYAQRGAVLSGNINLGVVGGYANAQAPLGGIVGNAVGAVIEANGNEGNVWGQTNVGGIVGLANACQINNNESYGVLTALTNTAGGIVGASQGATKIDGAVHGGTVQVYYSSQKALGPNAGGILGSVLSGTPTISNVLNAGDVYGTDKLGGIIGNGGGTISGAVNNGEIVSMKAADGEGLFVGGLVGYATVATTISDSYNAAALESATAAVANLVAGIATNVNVTASEAYFVNDFGAPAETVIGQEVSMAELAALGSSEDAAAAKAAGLRAPSSDVFDFGDKFTLPMLKAYAEHPEALVQAAAVIPEEGTYDDCTKNLRISGLKDVEWAAFKDVDSDEPVSADYIEFDPEKNYAYVTVPSTEAITITATCGDFAKSWSVQLNVATGVIEVKDLGEKTIDNVTYYNVNGQESKKAFDGVNIVVTRYTDGTSSTVKVVK